MSVDTLSTGGRGRRGRERGRDTFASPAGSSAPLPHENASVVAYNRSAADRGAEEDSPSSFLRAEWFDFAGLALQNYYYALQI